MENNSLTPEEIELYSRQLILSTWGTKQQLTLKNLSILISENNLPAAFYLASAGIGKIEVLTTSKNTPATTLLKTLHPNITFCTLEESKNKNYDYTLATEEGTFIASVKLAGLLLRNFLSKSQNCGPDARSSEIL